MIMKISAYITFIKQDKIAVLCLPNPLAKVRWLILDLEP